MKWYPILLVCAGCSASVVSCEKKTKPSIQQHAETTTVVCDSPKSEPINTSDAREWLKYFKEANPNDKNKFASTTFDKKAVIAMLDLPGVEGIKIYYAYDKKKSASQPGTKPIHYARLILMPVDGCGTDLVRFGKQQQVGGYYLLTSPMRCPDNCDQNQ